MVLKMLCYSLNFTPPLNTWVTESTRSKLLYWAPHYLCIDPTSFHLGPGARHILFSARPEWNSNEWWCTLSLELHRQQSWQGTQGYLKSCPSLLCPALLSMACTANEWQMLLRIFFSQSVPFFHDALTGTVTNGNAGSILSLNCTRLNLVALSPGNWKKQLWANIRSCTLHPKETLWWELVYLQVA